MELAKLWMYHALSGGKSAQQHRRGGDLAALLQHVQPSGLQLLSKIRPRIRLQITIIVPLPQPDPIHPRNALQNQPVRRVQLPRLRSAKNRLPTIHSCTPSLPSLRQTRSSRAFRLSAPPIPHSLRVQLSTLPAQVSHGSIPFPPSAQAPPACSAARGPISAQTP